MMRVRPVRFVIQPVLVADDGDELRLVEVDPIPVDAADLHQWVTEGLPHALAALESELSESREGDAP